MNPDDGRRTIARILEVFSGKMPLSLLDQLADQDVVCYMDRVRLNAGRGGLGAWFSYIHAIVRERQMSVDVDVQSIEAIGPGLYHVSGEVMTRGQKGSSDTAPFVLTYLIQQERVMKVWSTRSNYAVVLGRSIELPLYVGFLYHLLRALYNNPSCYASSSRADSPGS